MNFSRIIENRYLHRIVLFVMLNISCIMKAQLTTNPAISPTQLVQNVLLGSGVTASNITYTGHIAARGSFDGTLSNIGFASGVILASGSIYDAAGPNNDCCVGNDLNQPGDKDLDSVAINYTYDAAVLEFDFIPLSDTIKFRYAFGSEEYMEYVNAGVNDAFGFFVSGPGISGPFSNNSKNIALIPGTNTPVTIDSVNLNVHGAYYFDNGDGFGSGTAPDGLSIQYDGFTVPITAKIVVQCGKTYHIKIAIADAGDGILDSGVFLEAGTFGGTGEAVTATSTIKSQGIKDSILYEGCGDACITFVRHGLPITSNVTYPVTYGGTASNGADVNLPTSITFTPGKDTVTWCFSPAFDSEVEDAETLDISLVKEGTCAEKIAKTSYTIKECPVSIPNVISPDANAINNKFIVHGSEADPHNQLKIFNRWGNKLYEITDYQNDWGGENYSDGTYYYVYTTGDGRAFPGFFQIVRSIK